MGGKAVKETLKRARKKEFMEKEASVEVHSGRKERQQSECPRDVSQAAFKVGRGP